VTADTTDHTNATDNTENTDRTERGRAWRFVVGLWAALLVFTASGAAQSTPGDNALRTRIEEIRQKPTTVVRGERLMYPAAVAKFFEARAFAPVWRVPNASDEILKAIRASELDGLTPTDYHLAAITGALDAHARTPTAETTTEVQVLLADAVAALADHGRFGKVRPSSLDQRWNVDPRVDAPPLETTLDEIAKAAAIDAALDALKPKHFIYLGLKQALARMRTLAAAGGWTPIPLVGPSIKPGASDARVPAIRKRLSITGELAATAATTDQTYDADLQTAVKNFQAHHRLTDDGVIGKGTLDAMNVSADARVGQLRVNLERARWVVGGLRDTFVLVNLPAFKAYVIRDRKNVWETRTQIGRAARQTPTFRAEMKYLVLNPDWTVPPTILAQDVLGGMRKGENTIAKKRLTILDDRGQAVDPNTIDWQNATPRNFRYTLRQPPGPDNALGKVKFIFPNEYSIFLHDTPSRELFAADQRTFSSGCIRIENPLDLARLLLADNATWTPTKIQETLDSKQSQTIFLDTPLQVLIVYWTASVGATGEVRFAKDVYNLDLAVLRQLGSGSPVVR
jgi:murein L,D-transpeptidase YcbB/YkuD